MRSAIDRFRCSAALRAGSVFLAWLALAAGRSLGSPLPPAQTGPTPQVRVDYFEAERGYTVRQDDVVLLCVVHNVGGVALPEKTLRLHCLPLAGLDYTSGDTRPPLPALAPDQSVAFRWRFTATDIGTTPVAAVLVEPITGVSGPDVATQAADVALAVAPRFDAVPHFGAPIAGADVAPQAGFVGGEAWLGSNRVGLRVFSSMRGEPILLLAVRIGADWQTAALGLPLARVLTGEAGQVPWWQSFRWRQTRSRSDKDTATLTLVGAVGDCWHAELEFTTRRDTGAVEGRLRLTARRNTRFQALQLPRLLLGSPERDTSRADGSPTLLPPFTPALTPDTRVAATRTPSGTTCGLTWPLATPLAGWAWTPLPTADPDTMQALGVRCVGPTPGDLILVGATVEFPFRLFALAPSDTVRDALRFALP